MATRYSSITGLPLAQLDQAPAVTDYNLIRSKYKTPHDGLEKELNGGHNTVSQYVFSATMEEFLSVLGTTDSGNALLLLHHGMRSAEDVESFLTEHRLVSLRRDHRAITAAALESGLDPMHLMEMLDGTYSNERHSKHAADAVRTFALEKEYKNTLWFRASLAKSVLNGEARYEDVKTMGVALVHRHYDIDELSDSLYALATVDAPGFTAEHVRGAIERRIAAGMDREVGGCLLKLVMRYGGDEGLAVQNPVLLRNIVHVDASIEEQSLLLPYADEVYTFCPEPDLRIADINAVRKHGVSAEEAAKGFAEGRSAQQIIAMHDGVEAALTGGWL